MKSIFSPVFNQILALVERQIHAVKLQTNGSLKVSISEANSNR
jgi:hypothetical protein